MEHAARKAAHRQGNQVWKRKNSEAACAMLSAKPAAPNDDVVTGSESEVSAKRPSSRTAKKPAAQKAGTRKAQPAPSVATTARTGRRSAA